MTTIEERVKEFEENMRKALFGDEIKDFLRQALKDARESERERLSQWLEHSRGCILSQFSAGEPTEDGGYRNKYAGKWYQSRPIDKTPKCDCGLDEALTALDAELQAKNK